MTATKQSDSLAVAADYIHNAKRIEQDLIRLDWAIKREVVYKAQLSSQEQALATLKSKLESLTTANTGLSKQVATLELAVEKQALKTRAAKLEVWAMRLAVALYLAGRIRGVLP